MINWLKNLFKTKPGEGVVPIAPSDVKLREYVYMGDGMMEEVTPRRKEAQLSEEEVKSRLKKLNEEYKRRRSAELDMTPIVVTAAAVSSWTGDSSYSSYDSGSCDSSSSSCD